MTFSSSFLTSLNSCPTFSACSFTSSWRALSRSSSSPEGFPAFFFRVSTSLVSCFTLTSSLPLFSLAAVFSSSTDLNLFFSSLISVSRTKTSSLGEDCWTSAVSRPPQPSSSSSTARDIGEDSAELMFILAMVAVFSTSSFSFTSTCCLSDSSSASFSWRLCWRSGCWGTSCSVVWSLAYSVLR